MLTSAPHMVANNDANTRGGAVRHGTRPARHCVKREFPKRFAKALCKAYEQGELRLDGGVRFNGGEKEEIVDLKMPGFENVGQIYRNVAKPALYEQIMQRREVTFVNDFYLGNSPVTQAQYEAVTGANPTDHEEIRDAPIDSVKWDQANEYCQKLTKLDREAGVLPDGATPEGICDLIGYMDEMRSDWHDPDYYAHSPRKDPKGPTAPGPYENAKVTRGGLERPRTSGSGIVKILRDSQSFGVLPTTYLPRGWSRGKAVPPEDSRLDV